MLLKLPPTMEFSRSAATKFFDALRSRFDGAVVVEPRHASWFTGSVDRQLDSSRIARAVADPCVVPAAAEPGGWRGLSYYRLHGSPLMYESAYGAQRLEELAASLCECAQSGETWCVFDNTKFGAAAIDALALEDEHVPLVRSLGEPRAASMPATQKR